MSGAHHPYRLHWNWAACTRCRIYDRWHGYGGRTLVQKLRGVLVGYRGKWPGAKW